MNPWKIEGDGWEIIRDVSQLSFALMRTLIREMGATQSATLKVKISQSFRLDCVV